MFVNILPQRLKKVNWTSKMQMEFYLEK